MNKNQLIRVKFVPFLTLVITLIYFVNLFLTTTRVKPSINPFDSPSYFEFSIFPSFRMQLVTVPYALIQNLEMIIYFQALVSALSWSALIYSIYVFTEKSLIALLMTPAFLVLASSSVVLEYNYILGSESLNNSAIVFFLASLLLLVKNQATKEIIFVYASLIMLAGTKSSSAPAALAVGLMILIGLIIFKLINSKKQLVMMLIGFLFLIFFTATAFSSDITKTLTTSGTINNRIWYEPNWRDQVIESNYDLKLRTLWLNYSDRNLGSPPDQAVVDTDQFKSWWSNGGDNFLNVFMLKNLDYTLIGPFCLPCLSDNYSFNKTLLSGWSKGTNDSLNYETLQNLQAPRTIFWPLKPEDSYLALGLTILMIAAAVFLQAFSKNRKYENMKYYFIISLTYIISFSLISWWFGSKPVDMTRHQLAGAIGLRVIALVGFTYLLAVIWDSILNTKLGSELKKVRI